MKLKYYLLLLGMISIVSPTYASSDWLAQIDDNAYIDQLSIPGAHDAATGEGTLLDMFAKTQDLTLTGQFEAGIRAFDLRPSVDDNILKIYHGLIATNITFVDAMTTFANLLEQHPTEFVIVIMRHEDSHESDSEKSAWSTLMTEALNSESLANRLAAFDPDLTVEQMRGKILILSRDKYSAEPIGGLITGWSHSTDFTEQKKGCISGNPAIKSANLCVQDFYETDGKMDDKLQALRTVLNYSAKLTSQPDHWWVINHTSGYKATTFATADAYRSNAMETNKAAIDYLNDKSLPHGPTGLVMMDFAGVDKSESTDVYGKQLIDAVINHNSSYEMQKANK